MPTSPSSSFKNSTGSQPHCWQKLLPAGFEVNSPSAGPAKGANLNVVLIDYLMVQDPEGKTLPPRTTVALNVPSKRTASGSEPARCS